ncbi:hypothetical protein ELI00_37515 [Rhizobium ruizarguesonis]|uniref:hypothetical protein n=1 Tax=Rhizobium ruizarguesonis TaxID=2081791 RepID=UPI001032330B|nr:hypothetical protein [Rhizobium ruizarguesonis]TAX63343.1 hypothetical protein ELI00_37515 [Rhizobium ruizarguesonis]
MTAQEAASLSTRLAALERLETEIVEKAQRLVPKGSTLTPVDQFIFGAIKRTLSQSRAFRQMVGDWNFASAAVMVRTQLDTAMRINGIRYMPDVEGNISRIFNGETTYRKLQAINGTKMTDSYLKAKLADDHQWVSKLYDDLSDFVHLSFRHFWPVMAGIDDENKIAYFAISAQDPKRNEANYYEVTDAFFHVTKLTGTMLVSLLMARHSPPPPTSGAAGVEERREADEPSDTATSEDPRPVPEAIVDLISELSGSADPGEKALVAEDLRQVALFAKNRVYRRERAKVIAGLPDHALDKHRDIEEAEEASAAEIAEQIPRSIVDLVRELLKAEEESPDHAKLTEVFRRLAVEASTVLYRVNVNRIAAKLPADAFEGEAVDIDAPGYEPVDLDIGLRAKKNPAE